MLREFLGFSSTPKNNVGIQQEPQSFNTSQSFSSSTGDMISPVIFMRSFMQPSHESDLGGGGGCVTIAIGSPLRVTMIDFPVLWTLSNKRKHVALNFEMGIVSRMSGSRWI
jgi:hypothetical protein